MTLALPLTVMVAGCWPTPPKPGPKPKGQKKIDDGKIRVLREGGWSITAIADEMKLSAPTVKAHLQKMGVK